MQCRCQLKDNTTKIDSSGKRVDAMSFLSRESGNGFTSVLRVARQYVEATGDYLPLKGRFLDAARTIVSTYRAMQMPLTADNFTDVNYTFQTLSYEPKDTSPNGIGRAHKYTGMIRTSFLPSDDSPRLYHTLETFLPPRAL